MRKLTFAHVCSCKLNVCARKLCVRSRGSKMGLQGQGIRVYDTAHMAPMLPPCLLTRNDPRKTRSCSLVTCHTLKAWHPNFTNPDLTLFNKFMGSMTLVIEGSALHVTNLLLTVDIFLHFQITGRLSPVIPSSFGPIRFVDVFVQTRADADSLAILGAKDNLVVVGHGHMLAVRCLEPAILGWQTLGQVMREIPCWTLQVKDQDASSAPEMTNDQAIAFKKQGLFKLWTESKLLARTNTLAKTTQSQPKVWYS